LLLLLVKVQHLVSLCWFHTSESEYLDLGLK
jgi:hypothetical protein